MEAIKLQTQKQIISRMIPCEELAIGHTATQTLSVISNKPATLACLVKEEYPLSIIRASREGGVEQLTLHIAGMINDYLEMVGVKNTMNERQVLMAAQLIVEKHPHLPVKSLEVFFKDCVAGEFGPHYNRMDIPTLMQWLQKFEDNYFEMVDEQAYAEHTSTKGDKGVDLMAIIKSKEQGEEVVEMPDSIKKQLHIKREETLSDKIRAKVIKENSHLFSTLSFEDAQQQITNLINDELIKQGIFNLD